MAMAVCPDCETPQKITPTGEQKKPGFSAEWWQIDAHKHPEKPEVCDGSGKKV